MEDVARSLDPQKWDTVSTLFYDSYLVDAPSCCPPSGTSTCTFTPKPKSTDPAVGQKYPAGRPYGITAFFENFCSDKACPVCEGDPPRCVVQFKNILCVETEYDQWTPLSCLASLADSYKVTYHFGGFLFGELNGVEGQRVASDGGTLSVRRATSADTAGLSPGDWSVVTVTKTLTFSSPSISIGMAKVLKSLEKELKKQIVDQACYDVPAECWASW